MVHKAQQEYPELSTSDAIQREADKGPGKEAIGPNERGSLTQRGKESMQVMILIGFRVAYYIKYVGYVGNDTGFFKFVLFLMKTQGVVGAAKQMNPGTRDMKEKHC